MADKLTLTDKGGDSKFLPHPTGQFPAVCVDAIDLGPKVKTFPGSPPSEGYEIALVFATGERQEDGSLHTVSMSFTPSLNAKANLRKFLEAWRGRAYTEDQVKGGVPMDKFVGVPAYLNITHKTSAAGRTYAVVGSVMPLPKGLTAPTVAGYERAPYWQTRKEEYAKEVAAFRAAQVHAKPESFDDFPEALDHDDDPDSLPF